MLHLHTFGRLSLESPRPEGATAGRRPLAVVAMLAVAGPRGLSRDKIIAALWPESDEDRGRNSLSQALTALRRESTGGDPVVGSTELRLDPDEVTSDVGDFQRLMDAGEYEGAAALYVGPFLDGLFLKGAPELERWVDQQRSRLRQRYALALTSLAERSEADGNVVAAVGWWRKLAELDPCSVRTAVGLMRALVASGDRPAALQHYAVHRILLREEYDAEPEAAVTELAEEIRARFTSVCTLSGARVSDDPRATEPANRPREDGSVPATLSRERVAESMGARRSRSFVRGSWLFGAMLAVFVTVFAFRRGLVEKREVIVVAPLDNATADSSLDILGRMTADWVTQGIAQTGLMTVVDLRMMPAPLTRDGVASASQRDALGDLARRVNASMVVRGTLYLNRGDVVAQMQLVALPDGRAIHAWSDQIPRSAAPSMLPETLRQSVLGVLAARADSRFVPWANAASRPPRYEAYRAFVSGLAHAARGQRRDAVDLFQRAAALDTEFVQAKLYAIQILVRGNLADSLFAAAVKQRDRLAPYDRAALDHLAAVKEDDWEGRLLASREMARLVPTSGDAQIMHALDAAATNRFAEAMDALHRVGTISGLESDAEAFSVAEQMVHHSAGDFEREVTEMHRLRIRHGITRCGGELRGLAALGRSAAVDSLIASCAGSAADAPRLWQLQMTAATEYLSHGHRELAQRYLADGGQAILVEAPPAASKDINWALGNWAAVSHYSQEAMKSTTPSLVDFGRLGVAAAHLGDRETAIAMLQRIGEAAPRSNAAGGWRPAMWQAFIAAALGDRQSAHRSLDAARRRGMAPVLVLSHERAADPLRGDAEFERLFKSRR